MIVELHCHTSEYSACSHVNAIELITRAFRMGMQAIIITDHHYQWNDEDLKVIKEKAGLPDIFHVLAGQEFKTSDYGDVLIYGLKETVKKQELTLEELRNRYPEAAIIWAHPYRHNHVPPKEKLLNPLHDGIEIFSSNYTFAEASRALKDYHELKFTAIAGTDTHALSYTGSYPTLFDHPFETIEEMVAEVKAGRCRPYFKEILREGTTDTKVTEVVIGSKSSHSQKKIILKTYSDIQSWKEGERSHHILEEISRQGFDSGKFRVAKPLDSDPDNLGIIEEKISGELLYDVLLKADADKAKEYLKMAAAWLAKLHNLHLKITPEDEFLPIEKERLKYYLSGMYENNHPHTARAQLILDEIYSRETEIINSNPQNLVQGHGDYHLKNIFIGRDENDEEYAAAIDFNSSFQLPRSFDVGTFLAQYKNMYIEKPEVFYKAPPEIFLDEYIRLSDKLENNFYSNVNLYKSRTDLSIIYYLVKVGKGESENFWTILVDAERNLAHMNFNRRRS